MHDVAWRGMWICLRSKDAQKQLARTSLILKIISSLQILKLEVEKVAAQRSFLFLWCGSHEGLNEGRKVLIYLN